MATSIPIGRHLITDRDLEDPVYKDQMENTAPISVEKTLTLLVDRHSKSLISRHVRAIQKLTQAYSDGFMMKDLDKVREMIAVCCQRVEKDHAYESPLCNLIKLCGYPIWKEKMSDESQFSDSTVGLFSELGQAICVKSVSVRSALVKAVIKIYTEPSPESKLFGKEALTLEFKRAMTERSNMARALVDGLSKIESLDIRLEIMRMLQYLSSSALNCDDMLRGSAASLICSAMNIPDPSGGLLFLSVEILWNLLELGSQQEVANQLNCVECISSLRDTFVQQMTEGYSLADKQLRNDLLVISTLVAEHCPKAPFVETGFTRLLVLYATFTEVKSNHELVKNLQLYQDHEDFEFKKLLMNVLVVLGEDPAAIPLMAEGKALLSLLSFVRANENSQVQEWSPAQFEELQLQALAVLATLGPVLIEDYMMCQANTRLLLLLEWCVGQADYGGHGNSFHGTGGRGNKRAQMRYCLRLLRSMCSTGDDGVLQDMVDQGAIHQLTGILLNASTSQDENDAVDIEMQCDMLFIVSSLAEGDAHRKELFGSSGVQVVVQFLGKDPHRINSPLGHHQLLLAAVDCVWSAVLGCYMTEQMFLEMGGVRLLLDLLEICPITMQNLVLGCLVDLSDNMKTLPHFLMWRGKKDITVCNLLIELWRREEESMGVQRNPDGTIKDCKKPLMGRIQERRGVLPLPSNCPSEAIVDISENMRAKIYSLFCKIGFNEVPGLSAADYVTLTIIEKYMDFKLLEVWKEIGEELEKENVRPVTPDSECLNDISRILEERVLDVQTTQSDLLQIDEQRDLVEEQEMYQQIKISHSQEDNAYRDFCDYIARTSDLNALQLSKQKQLAAVEASRLQGRIREGESFHETLQKNLRTTTFAGRQINVKSTPAEITRLAVTQTPDQDKKHFVITQ